jgi:hypothetical protein
MVMFIEIPDRCKNDIRRFIAYSSNAPTERDNCRMSRFEITDLTFALDSNTLP